MDEKERFQDIVTLDREKVPSFGVLLKHEYGFILGIVYIGLVPTAIPPVTLSMSVP